MTEKDRRVLQLMIENLQIFGELSAELSQETFCKLGEYMQFTWREVESVQCDIEHFLKEHYTPRGIRVLTDEGSKLLYEKELGYKRANKIHWKKDCLNEPWYESLKAELFAPEYEGKYWERARIERRCK